MIFGVTIQVTPSEGAENVYPMIQWTSAVPDPDRVTSLLESLVEAIAQEGMYTRPAPVAGPDPEPAKSDTKVEPAGQPGAGSAAAAPVRLSQKMKTEPAPKPVKVKVKLATFAKGTRVRYTNTENQGFYGKTGHVILNRGAMAHVDFGKDGQTWCARKYCEEVPA